MPLLKRKRVMAAKVETTPGTDAGLAADDGAFNAYDVEIQPSIEVEEREAQGSFNFLTGVSGARSGTATFTTDIGWDGTTTMPNWATILLAGCGVVESSQVFTPRSEAPGSNVKNLTLGVYEDGLLKKLVGSAGTFQLIMPAGRMARIEWEFTGVWQAVTDESLIAPTYPTASPLRFADATATYSGSSIKVEQVTLDAGNEVVLREDATTAAGYSTALVTSRRPMVTANPEAVLVATQDRFGNWLSDTEAALQFVIDGPAPSTTTSTITIDVPKAQIVNSQEADRNRVAVEDIEFAANKNGATEDEEFKFTFAESTA